MLFQQCLSVYSTLIYRYLTSYWKLPGYVTITPAALAAVSSQGNLIQGEGLDSLKTALETRGMTT